MTRVPHAVAAVLAIIVSTPAGATVRETGAFETTIPIEVPSYYGITPTVTLGYSSTIGNGQLGVGWRLNAGSTVRRMSRTYGAPRYDATDIFLVDGQELVPCNKTHSPGCDNGASHAFRNETFQHVLLSSNVWRVLDKDGTRRVYRPMLGNTSSQTTTLVWTLAHVTDRTGNEVNYTYDCDSGRACYLTSIEYGDGIACEAHDAPTGARITFAWQSRADIVTVGTGAGFEDTRNRLQRITVAHGGGQQRAYELDYTTSKTTGASLLHAVRELGGDNTTRGRTRTFDYPAANGSMQPFTPSQTAANNTFLLGPFTGASQALASTWATTAPVGEFGQLGDFDGDGRADYVSMRMASDCSVVTVATRLAGTSTDIVQDLAWTSSINIPHRGDAPSGPASCWLQAMVADINGDGRKDLLIENGSSVNDIELVTMLALPEGGFAPPSNPWHMPVRGIDENRRCRVGDLDGDGRDDYVCKTSDQGGSWTIVSELSVGDGTFQERVVPAPAFALASRLTAVDVNGDGLDDLVVAGVVPIDTTTGLNNYAITTGIGDGHGGFAWEPTQMTTLVAQAADQVYVGDFDGDGRRDLMIALQGTADTVIELLLDRGVGATRWQTSSETVTGLSNQSVLGVGDVDLDGTSELMIAIHHAAGHNLCTGGGEGFDVGSMSRGADGTFFAGTTVDEDMQCGAPIPGAARPQVADANGDGRPDWIAAVPVGGGMAQLLDQPASNRTNGKRAWQRADVNGDGREDWVSVVFGNTGLDVSTVITRPDGQLQRMPDVHIASSSLGESMSADSVRQWFAVDVGSSTGAPDGRSDIVVIDDRVRTITTLLSNGDGTYTAVVREHDYTAQRTPERWLATDFDGDGRTDLVRVVPTVVHDQVGTQPAVAVLSLRAVGDGTWSVPPGGPSIVFVGTVTPRLSTFRAIDLDGDGRGDLVQIDARRLGFGSSMFDTTVRTLRSQNDGTFVGTTMSFPQLHPDAQRFMVVDINGDGRGDLARIDLASGEPILTYALGVGDGTFTGLAIQGMTGTLAPALGEHRRFFAADLDQDGRTDFYTLWPVDGANGTVSTTLQVMWNRPWLFTTQAATGLLMAGRDTPQFQLDDANADGHPDLVRLGSSVDRIIIDAPPARMTAMTTGMGATTHITYATSVGAGGNLPPAVVLPVVHEVSLFDDVRLRPIETTTYAFRGLYYDYSHRRTVGFVNQEVDAARSHTVTAYSLDDHCGAKVMASELRTLGDAVLTRTSMGYVTDSVDDKAPYVCLAENQVAEHCEGTKDCLTTATHYTYDEFGNVVRLWEEGDITDPTDDRLTNTPVYPQLSAWIVARPAYRQVMERVPDHQLWTWEMVSYVEHLYDNATSSATPPKAGLLTAELRWNNQTGLQIRNEIAYDKFGNVVKRTGPPTLHAPQGVVEKIDYECAFHRFPVKDCTGASCTTMTWDFVRALVSTTTNGNGDTTTSSYDVFGRRTKIENPDGSSQMFTPPDWSAPSLSQHSVSTISDASPDGLWTERYLDGLGRVWRTIEEGGRITDVDYDLASDRPAQTSNPYLDTESPRWTRVAYDAADRRSQSTSPDNATRTWTYEVGAMTAFDETHAPRTTFFDGYSRISAVLEVLRQPCPGGDSCPIAATYLTTYGYDVLDRNVWIRDTNGNLSTQRYDSLSNRLGNCSFDRGCEEATFADDGLVIDAKDALGNVHHHDYDMFGRLVGRTTFDPAGTTERTVRIKWDVDPATNRPRGHSVDRVVRVDDSGHLDVSRLHMYDAMGRITTDEDCVDNNCQTTTKTYDLAGRLTSVTYPDASVVTYVYNARGLLQEVPGYATYVYGDATNRATLTTLHNGVVEKAVHSLDRMWTDRLEVIAKSGSFVEVVGHDLRGLVDQLDTTRGRSQTTTNYIHDDLRRLTKVTSTDPSLRGDYDYDGIGNMTKDSSRGSIDYLDVAHPHAPTAISGAKLTYDKLGQLLRSDRLDVEWNADGNPSSIKDLVTQRGSAHAYDADGTRVWRSSAAGTESWFSPLVSVDAKGTLVMNVLAQDRVIAQRDSKTVTYLHGDHLASVRALTDASGNVIDERDYTTWGTSARPFSVPNVIASFAESEQQQDDGDLVRLGARWYQPATRTFVSADTIMPHIYQPQTLNAYSYVTNDPATLSDPTGHEGEGGTIPPEGPVPTGPATGEGEGEQPQQDVEPPQTQTATTVSDDAPVIDQPPPPPPPPPGEGGVTTPASAPTPAPVAEAGIDLKSSTAGRKATLLDGDYKVIKQHHQEVSNLYGKRIADLTTPTFVETGMKSSAPTPLERFIAETRPANATTFGPFSVSVETIVDVAGWGYLEAKAAIERYRGTNSGVLFKP